MKDSSRGHDIRVFYMDFLDVQNTLRSDSKRSGRILYLILGIFSQTDTYQPSPKVVRHLQSDYFNRLECDRLQQQQRTFQHILLFQVLFRHGCSSANCKRHSPHPRPTRAF